MFSNAKAVGLEWNDRGDNASFDFTAPNFTKDNAEHELDLSGIIGSQESLVLIGLLTVVTASNVMMRVMTNGYSNNINSDAIYSLAANGKNERNIWIKTDIDGKIMYLCQTGTWIVINFVVRGWFKL